MWKKSIFVSALSLSALSATLLPATVATSALIVSPSAMACTPYDYFNGTCTFDNGDKFPEEQEIVSCRLGVGEYQICEITDDSDCGSLTRVTTPTVFQLPEDQCLALGGSIVQVLNM